MVESIPCNICGGTASLQDSAKVYRRSYGPIYICDDHPDCDSYVGVHRGTTKPKGTLAGPELRDLRKRCHAAFDPLWRSGAMNRKQAYKWMIETMGIKAHEAHIAMFDAGRCAQLLTLLEVQQSDD